MKYVFQLGMIAGISFTAEMLYALLPLPVPASIYGLFILFLLLMTKIIKVEQVEEISDFFLLIMPVLFISPSVSLITSFDRMKGQVFSLIFIAVLSTIGTTAVTGMVAQLIIRKKKRKDGKKAEEQRYE